MSERDGREWRPLGARSPMIVQARDDDVKGAWQIHRSKVPQVKAVVGGAAC